VINRVYRSAKTVFTFIGDITQCSLLILLAFESSSVMAMRTMKLIAGDSAAMDEARLMINEKVDAAFEATVSLMGGVSGDDIIHRYRHHVAVNAKRLNQR
jgi:hypothetical protein